MDAAGQVSPASGPRDILGRLRDEREAMSAARGRIADEILRNPSAAGTLTITDLADRSQTNAATISRFAVHLGFTGYQALRSAISRDAGRIEEVSWAQDIGAEITTRDSPTRVLEVLARDRYRALRSTVAVLDVGRVDRLATAIAHARHVRIYGEWGDGIVARELHIRLERIGVASWHVEGERAAAAAAIATTTEDVAIAVSRTGDDPVAARFLESSAQRGAVTGCLTGATDGALWAMATLPLFTGTTPGQYWTDYATGRESDSLAASLLWVRVRQLREP